MYPKLDSKWNSPYTKGSFEKLVDCYKVYLSANPKLLHDIGEILDVEFSLGIPEQKVLHDLINPPKDTLRLMITGTRDITDASIIYDALESARIELADGYEKIVFINGGARGVDRVSEKIVHSVFGWEVLTIPALWNDENGNFNRLAGAERNEVMLHLADAVLAVWDGSSRGTKNAIDLAKKKGLPIKIILTN